MRGARRRRAGVTLIEVIYAILVLAVIAIGAGVFVQRAWQRMRTAKDRRVALDRASAQLEQLLNEDRDVIAGQAGTATSTNLTINGRAGYVMTTRVDDTGPDDCYELEVTVQYVPGEPDSVVRLETLRAP